MLALLCGANPRISKDGPRVRITPGKWCVEVDYLKDSVLGIYLNDTLLDETHEKLFSIEQASTVQIKFQNRGTESFINAWLKPIK
jgi:hypothetical protein